MPLEPTSVQRDKMLSRGKTKQSLVQFLVLKDPEDFLEYLEVTKQAVLTQGGTRDHQFKIDQLLTAGKLPYHFLTIDNYPSSQALLLAHENMREIRSAALDEIYGMIVKSNPAIKKLTKGLGFLSSFLTNILGTGEVKRIEQISASTSRLDPETDPDPGKVVKFSSKKLDEPFYMMNLNQFSPGNKQRTGGKAAYNQYSARIMPRLISVGGYPDIYGEILGTYIGDQKSQLFSRWDDFALVYYPSRTNFLRLMTNTPRGAAEIRRAGLKKVVLMPCSKLKTNSP